MILTSVFKDFLNTLFDRIKVNIFLGLNRIFFFDDVTPKQLNRERFFKA